MRTKDIRSEALGSFIKCFNLCYPDWEIKGESSQPLTEEYVEYTYCKSSSRYLGRLRWWPDGRIKFAIDSSWYEEATPGKRLGLLIHELAHVGRSKKSNHPPEFWEQAVNNYETLKKHAPEVETEMMGTLDWKDTREYLVTDPHPGMVDHRSEITCERRLAIARRLDYPLDKFDPFAKMHITMQDGKYGSYTEVPLWNLIYEEKSLSDLIDCFYERPRTHLTKKDNTFFIERPVVREIGDAYRVVEGDERVALAARIGENSIPCDVVDSDTRGTVLAEGD